MKDYKKLKISLKIFLILMIFIILGIDTSVLVYVLIKGSDGWNIIISLIITLLLLPICLTLFNKLYFNKLRIKIISDTFNSLDKDKLVFTRKKNVNGEVLTKLRLEDLANEFYVSSVIDGTYNGVNVLAFSCDYTRTGKRKDQVLMRLYTFEFKSNLKKNYQFKEFKSKILDDSILNKHIKVEDNKLYLSYANPIKSFEYQFEPLAFKTYDEFLNRYKLELELIKNVCERVNKEFIE